MNELPVHTYQIATHTTEHLQIPVYTIIQCFC